MQFRLCLAGLAPHPDYLPLTSNQAEDWELFFDRHPFGPGPMESQLALIGFFIGKALGYNVSSPGQLMPARRAEPEYMTPRQIAIALRAVR